MSRKSLFTALCIISLCFIPLSGMAKMSALSDDQLSEVVGQAGFSIDAGTIIHFDSSSNNLFWRDNGGLGLLTQSGVLSLDDVTLKGSINFYEPLSINTGPGFMPFGIGMPFGVGLPQVGVGMPTIDIHIGGMSIDIDEFTIGAITIGPEPGVGPSLGSFGIYNMHVDIAGSIQISAR
ncbi:MAG: DUF6160 family protein [Desulfomonilia bacterium]|jgi:hypothetical protein|uniref:DUF6160 domain-containing protein n=1 Tax=anaerobic digester metagenome TaxID=1263854 RepID=A0A485LZT5_9ZZZZ|nr:hypothetical protein [Pseudomonadota bacterium]HON37509.1 hypothetical protein [Deltaproteobacteria bacterium]HRS55615.1 hypothetical protein [Desulfomonilia bacterium]HPD20685.1 hypothetical protein [Deltaproteobacteria bacterium]HPX19076.1 hypothetical protein [Deltaproteobacteria bacterium]